MQALLVEHLKFDPDEDGSRVEAHISLEEADRVDLLETRAGGSMLVLLLAEIAGVALLLFANCHNLLSDDGLVLIFHLVKVVCLEVVHQDGKTAHDFGLLLDSFVALAASRDVHLCADPIDFLEV